MQKFQESASQNEKIIIVFKNQPNTTTNTSLLPINFSLLLWSSHFNGYAPFHHEIFQLLHIKKKTQHYLSFK